MADKGNTELREGEIQDMMVRQDKEPEDNTLPSAEPGNSLCSSPRMRVFDKTTSNPAQLKFLRMKPRKLFPSNQDKPEICADPSESDDYPRRYRSNWVHLPSELGQSDNANPEVYIRKSNKRDCDRSFQTPTIHGDSVRRYYGLQQLNPLDGQFASVLREDEHTTVSTAVTTTNEAGIAPSRAPDKLNNNLRELYPECEHCLEIFGENKDLRHNYESDSAEESETDSNCSCNKLLIYSYSKDEVAEEENDEEKEEEVATVAEEDREAEEAAAREVGERGEDNYAKEEDDTAEEDDGPVKPNQAADQYRQLGQLFQSDVKGAIFKYSAGPIKPSSGANTWQRQSQIPRPDSTSSHSVNPQCVTKEAHLAMGQTGHQGYAEIPDPVASDTDNDPWGDKKRSRGRLSPDTIFDWPFDYSLFMELGSDKRSYADVVTGERSKPAHVHRPISSDSFRAAFGHIGQEMGLGIQRQQSDISSDSFRAAFGHIGQEMGLGIQRQQSDISSNSFRAAFGHIGQEMGLGIQRQQNDMSQHQQLAKTTMQLFMENQHYISWPPFVSNYNDHNNTDFESWYDGQNGGHPALDSYRQGYAEIPDPVASDTDNDPWGDNKRSRGRLSSDTCFDWPFDYSRFLELGSKHLETVTGHGTTNVDTRSVQQDHLLQVPDTTNSWTYFHNEWEPRESVFYEQHLAALTAWDQQQATAAHMYAPYGQMEAPVPTGIYPEADFESAYQVQAVATSSDSFRYSELCYTRDTA